MLTNTDYRPNHHNIGGTTMKKIHRTIVTALAAMLTSVVLVAPAPAHAADEAPIPPECEQTVQEWKIRAHSAEAETTRWQRAYFDTAMDLRAEQQRSASVGARLNAVIDELTANLNTANAEFDKVWKRAERRGDRIERLREKIRKLRRR